MSKRFNGESNRAELHTNNQEKEIVEDRISFNDLLFIIHKSLGLRHVSSKEVAEHEIKNGTKGDALAISGAFKLLSDKNKERLTENEIYKIGQKFKVSINSLLKEYPQLLDKEAQDQLLQTFSEKVKEFISVSFNLDINEENSYLKLNEIIKILIKKAPSFLIVTSNEKGGYDENKYHGLGKFGINSIESFLTNIYLDTEDFSDLNLPLDSTMDDKLFQHLCDFMTHKIFIKFSKAIKEMRKNNQ